jgi:hypothetical protein
MMIVNGKQYPMWGQLVENKADFIGFILEDMGDTIDRNLSMGTVETVVKDIVLKPNGDSSAMFEIIGEDFTCGFDVNHGGVIGGEKGCLTFSGYGGHIFRMKPNN